MRDLNQGRAEDPSENARAHEQLAHILTLEAAELLDNLLALGLLLGIIRVRNGLEDVVDGASL